MTITRKPTDGTTPEMVLGNLAATTVLTVWDAATKIGHRARLGTLREWLVARLVPPGTAGRVLVTNGAGGIADGGVLLEELGGGAPAAHAASHATGSSDPITPASIGAATTEEAGTALTAAQNALYPLVQTAHTASTKTLSAGDAGDIIPLNAASNAIAVTIPHTLFAAGGTGRAFRCKHKIVSVAGGAVTFVGSGGVVLSYNGKDPATTAFAAGDMLTIEMLSATEARITTVSQNASAATALLYALRPVDQASSSIANVFNGVVTGFIASATLRLNALPVGRETVLACRDYTRGWSIGVSALGFEAIAARKSDYTLQASTPTGLLAFSSYTLSDLLTRTFVISIRITPTEMRVFVNGVFAQAVPLTGGYAGGPDDSTGATLTIHHVIDGSTPASAAEFCACYYVDPRLRDVGGYTDAHVIALFKDALENGGTHRTGLAGGWGVMYAANKAVLTGAPDPFPYAVMLNTGLPASVASIFIYDTAFELGRGLVPLW